MITPMEEQEHAEQCETCSGAGARPSFGDECLTCEGMGSVCSVCGRSLAVCDPSGSCEETRSDQPL